MAYSILGNSMQNEESDYSRPDFFIDLNLDQVIARVLDKRRNYELKRYYYEIPDKLETVRYRQEVFRDMEKDVIYEGALVFSDEMRMAREFKEYSDKSIDDLQKKRWHLDSAYHYVKAVRTLHQSLTDGEVGSAGLKKLKDMVGGLLDGKEFQSLNQATNRLREEFDRMRVHVELSPGKMVISQEVQEENYLDHLVSLFPDTGDLPRTVENPFTNILKLSYFERKLLEVFQKNVPEAFAGLNEYYKRYKEYMEPYLLQFEQEVQFYLAFLQYREAMITLGGFFALPTVGDVDSNGDTPPEEDEIPIYGRRFWIKDAYDLALAWNIYSRRSFSQNYAFGKKDSTESGDKVVSNDAYFEGKEKFLVVTGPNQGGKTTFARSLGQVVYFSLIGLPAPCMGADIPMFSGILTHFSVEESIDTGKGKLKEELTRLQPMMQHLNQNKFVIINELFTTAATYDAYIMGNRVMERFINSGCYGVYVTHIQELAKESEAVVSLVAELDSEDKRIRTFRITRRKAVEGGYANAIVDKYHLNYEEIQERLHRLVHGAKL